MLRNFLGGPGGCHQLVLGVEGMKMAILILVLHLWMGLTFEGGYLLLAGKFLLVFNLPCLSLVIFMLMDITTNMDLQLYWHSSDQLVRDSSGCSQLTHSSIH